MRYSQKPNNLSFYIIVHQNVTFDENNKNLNI